MARYYIWPDEDRSYYKLIWRYPCERYDGFHVLGSRFHPFGDFDGEEFPHLPDESVRVYRTRGGYRVLYTDRITDTRDKMMSMFDTLDELGGDKLYTKYARKRGYFAARLEPKYPSPKVRNSVARLVFHQGEPLPQWEKIIELHDSWVHPFDINSVLA